jgi:exonuclease-1
VAPYEADAQLAFLSLGGYVDCIITEDSDLLAYGCSKVIIIYTKI